MSYQGKKLINDPKGGGSGHEPAQSGYVGAGMLTAAICGDVFTSPPVNSILAGIRAVTGPKGCLLIVTNYTGDRLNFGLAAEQAKSEGYKVEMVIVGDDCALPPRRGVAGRRGLAGTILVNKVAGAAADAGLSLADVAADAKRASEMMGTMGVALSVCTLPGQVTSDRLGPGLMELGLGIHGEPGAAVVDLQPVDVVVSHVLKQILSMAFTQPQELNEQGCILEAAIQAAANEIINIQDKLNEWDSKVGDGDCGTTMYRGATAVLEDMKKCYDIFCNAAYGSLKGSPIVTSEQWASALEASIAAISKYGGASAGYRTMLDALIPALTVLKEKLNAGHDPLTAFLLSSEAAMNGAESTKDMHAQAGRSTYVAADLQALVPDPGAMAAAAWYRAAALAVKDKLRPSQS
ncbi:hypothetical protein COCNU_05G009240 [Cocos nucifera]|uniref:3,4-dihydroxy-2-butanone kinase n=1 Tax=Cocos nucifera TaxID=13894 RepID=A0A8K0IAH7_COCNU|nr:hypothetical protein COCNU_05G009240 [Cocos nucifera]